LELDAGEWSALRLGSCAPGDGAAQTHRIGRWMVTRWDVNSVRKRKLSLSLPVIENLSCST